ncbi:MAG: DUF177 domain-containing protein [Actinobacteria bacterium]|nr:DUF177 domain-containing protein [Actinomycetota bacterium]
MTTRVHDFNISVAEILGQPGHHRDLHLEAPLNGVGTTLAHLEEKPLRADLRAESVVEGILITGNLEGSTILECARCLKEFRASVDLDVCELFLAPGAEPEDQEAYRISGTDIDLEPMLRDAVTLSLPLNPLCEEDCKGMCARCGRDLNLGACDCTEDTTDPRWAELDALRDRLSG